MFMLMPVDVSLASLTKENFAGETTTRGEGRVEPEALKNTPADVPIVKISQHPSVENSVKVTKRYPVELVTLYLQFKLFAYVGSVFVWRTKDPAVFVPLGHMSIDSAVDKKKKIHMSSLPLALKIKTLRGGFYFNF